MSAPALPPLWLMRHGQTEWNVARRIQGGRDSPLTEAGRAMIARQRDRLRPVLAMGGVICHASPLGRAQASAAVVFAGHPIRTDARLREIGMGAWEGELADSLAAAHPDAFATPFGWHDAAPGGEGLAALRARVTAFLSDLDTPAAILCHGITLRMMRAVALGLPFTAEAGRRFPQDAVHHIADGAAGLLD